MNFTESPLPAPRPTASAARILVVDDESYIRELMVKTLSRLGYEKVGAAGDGAEAWDALHAVNYDLVITDHKMPKVTGLELILRMRSLGMSQPVVLMSGTIPTEELNRHPNVRVDAMLPKPFTVAELASTIGPLLRTTDSPVVADENQFSRAQQPATALTRGQEKPLPRILVVDDEQTSRQLQVDLLTASGYQVEAACDGAAGWEALRSHDFDLIITDNHMPKMTGLELMENLHLSRMTIPVIMATGRLPTEEVARKPWLKPEALLQKPFANRDLLETIRNVLGSAGRQENQQPASLPKFF